MSDTQKPVHPVDLADLHWMARRYADGRQSYATSLFNEITRRLLAAGHTLGSVDGTPWARDGGGRAMDGLTDYEAAMGREPDWLQDNTQRRVEELEQRATRAEDALHQCYAATGEEAGDIHDFRALVDRERHAVEAVKQMRADLDRAEAELAALRKRIDGVVKYCDERIVPDYKAVIESLKQDNTALRAALEECYNFLHFVEPEIKGGYSPDGVLAKARAALGRAIP